MKIERNSLGGIVTIRLIGHLQLGHIGELQNQLSESCSQFVLDLEEVTLADVAVVRFLGDCESAGVRIVNCPRYIREWVVRESSDSGHTE